ncbi:hypothetical protein Tco_1020124 [Tanacetum coccineum]|uniref:Uncharacterized protein n=1 Tax=Tanacetum coccineum TaxID=301880 RepID=A0ABQ5G0T0_9ASTR
MLNKKLQTDHLNEMCYQLLKLMTKLVKNPRNFEMRLAKICKREVHRVLVFDFEGLTELMDEGLRGRMLMEYKDAQKKSIARRCMSWRKFILVLGLPTAEEMETDGFGMDVGSINAPYLLARYLRLFASGRKQGAMIFGGQFVAHMVEHFGLLTKERLQGLTAWIALGPKRQPDAMVGAPKAAEDAPIANEGALVVPTLMQAPQSPPPVAEQSRIMAQRLARAEEDFHEIRGALGE